MKKLKEFSEELDKVQNYDEWKSWHTQFSILICSLYGEKSREYQIADFNSTATARWLGQTSDISSTKKNSKDIIEGFITNIDTMGLPKNNPLEDKSINVNNNITQTQNVNVDFMQIIKNELPPIKLKEIEEILASKNSDKNKFQKIGEAIKNCSIDFASSTLAKIIIQLFKGK